MTVRPGRHPPAPALQDAEDPAQVRSLRWIEEFLAGLLERGFADEGAAAAYRAFTSFLLGHLLLEVSALGVDTGPVDEPPPAMALGEAPVDELDGYPLLVELSPLLARFHFDAEFEESLHNLLDRLGPGTGDVPED